MRAHIATLNPNTADGGYCHAVLVEDRGKRVYIHQNDLLDADLRSCQQGDEVDIDHIEENTRGTRGRDVTWIGRGGSALDANDDMFEGTVVFLGENGRQYGFVRPDGSEHRGTKEDVMIHASCFDNFLTFKSLTLGTRVRGRVHLTDRGRRGTQLFVIN